MVKVNNTVVGNNCYPGRGAYRQNLVRPATTTYVPSTIQSIRSKVCQLLQYCYVYGHLIAFGSPMIKNRLNEWITEIPLPRKDFFSEVAKAVIQHLLVRIYLMIASPLSFLMCVIPIYFKKHYCETSF